MATTISKASVKGYRQVEPNHLSAPKDGRVYAQLPADSSIEILEQGTFVKYDYAAQKIDFTGEGEWMMVFNEEKLYDERKQMHRDYAMKKEDFYDGVMVPRVFGMVMGDIFTTNNVKDDTYNVGDKLAPKEDGILGKTSGGDALVCKVVQETTMPDGQLALKLQVVTA